MSTSHHEKNKKQYYQKQKEASLEDLVPVNFKWPLWLKRDIEACAAANIESVSAYVRKIMREVTSQELKKLKKKSSKPV